MIRFENVSKTYRKGEIAIRALNGIDLAVWPGEYVAIMGPSGSGKSTMMNIIGCLDRPTSGRYMLDGVDVSSMDEDALAQIRLRRLGLVFQSFNLLPRATALRNVSLPLFYAGVNLRERTTVASEKLAEVGLGNRALHRPTELSGGEQQRVAIARALVNDPSVILADEPTGNLDSTTGSEIMALFSDLNQKGRTVIIVTHDATVAEQTRRVIRLFDGTIQSDSMHEGATQD